LVINIDRKQLIRLQHLIRKVTSHTPSTSQWRQSPNWMQRMLLN